MRSGWHIVFYVSEAIALFGQRSTIFDHGQREARDELALYGVVDVDVEFVQDLLSFISLRALNL